MNTINTATINLIKEFEGLSLTAYLCPAGVPTIGYGTTIYPNGERVKIGQHCNEEDATKYLMQEICRKSINISNYFTKPLTDNQYGALLSFAYNLGEGSLKQSTLLKKVNANPNDPSIANEFKKWVHANGKKLQGLVRRREAEAKLYFS